MVVIKKKTQLLAEVAAGTSCQRKVFAYNWFPATSSSFSAAADTSNSQFKWLKTES